MIENLPENMPVLALLLIFVIAVFQLCPKKSPMLRETFPSNTPTMKITRGRDLMKATAVGTPMNNTRVQCKDCQVWFPRLEWMKNKECDNPNCRCPEVKRLRQQTKEVIDKAMESSKVNVITIRRSEIDPTGYEEQTPQYMVDVPDVVVIDVIVPKQFRGKKR